MVRNNLAVIDVVEKRDPLAVAAKRGAGPAERRYRSMVHPVAKSAPALIVYQMMNLIRDEQDANATFVPRFDRRSDLGQLGIAQYCALIFSRRWIIFPNRCRQL